MFTVIFLTFTVISHFRSSYKGVFGHLYSVKLKCLLLFELRFLACQGHDLFFLKRRNKDDVIFFSFLDFRCFTMSIFLLSSWNFILLDQSFLKIISISFLTSLFESKSLSKSWFCQRKIQEGILLLELFAAYETFLAETAHR